MIDSVTANLLDTLEELRAMKATKEIAMTITKIEEALLWWAAQSRAAFKSCSQESK